jgi:hypothetical protein
MNRKEFITGMIGAVGAAVLPIIAVTAKSFPLRGRENYLTDNTHRDFSACQYCDAKVFEQHKIGCPRESALCRSCGSKTDVDLIDTSRPFGPERDRTVCFSCEPKARVILRYRSEYAMRMSAAINKTKCFRCGVGAGIIHEHGTPFDYRLCTTCAPEAKDCRRWVRDLRGWPRVKT